MDALLIATGETEKLRPLTAQIPAPMLPVANRPVLALAVEALARQGFKRMAVSLFERGEQIEAYFANGARWGVQLDYLLQREGWGDAGALKWAASHVTTTTLLLPGDAIVDVDVTAVARFHQAHGGLVTAVLRPANDEDQLAVWLHPNGAISAEPLDGPRLTFSGAYLVEPGLLAHIPAQTRRSLAADTLPELLAAGVAVYGWQTHGYCNPLRTFADYQAAQAAYLDSAMAAGQADGGPRLAQLPQGGAALRYPTLDGNRMGQGVWVGKQNVIHPTVRVRPPVLLGDNCRIGREVELGPYAVIGSGVVIDDEATVQHSTALPRTYIGQLVNVSGRVVQGQTLIDAQTEESTAVTDAFLLGESSALAVGVDAGRLADMAAAALLLFWLWPLLLLLGIAAWVQNGHLFTNQEVVGARRGDAQPASFTLRRFAARADGRLARWGLHRLPELWHVLRGDLALVGVKPLTPDEAAQVTEEWQRQRYACPAGLTGLWAVQTAPSASLDEVLMADTYYAATRSWREDVKILGRWVWGVKRKA
ncbi:MAG: sugar transferase [Anaerolineales bacterium]|nr:sugar transferase [Anaerolineales bacterium]MCB8983662.1 sugar transferase [Ardenticatenaceae bacterium]